MYQSKFLIITKKPILCAISEQFEPNQSLFDMHYELEIGIVLAGSKERQYRNYHTELMPGHAWLCGMLEAHSRRIIQVPFKAVVFIFKPESLMNLLAFTNPNPINILAPFWQSPANRPQADAEVQKELLQIGSRIEQLQTLGPSLRGIWALTYLMQALLLLFRPGQEESKPADFEPYERIRQGLNLVFQNRHRFVGIEEAAKRCAMNRNSFNLIFRKIMGRSFAKFALGFRIQGSAMELLKTHHSTKEIAAAWGFTDSSHYHRCFTSYYGCSPKKYRLQSQSQIFPE